MPRVIHFEISANDMEQVKEFYENVFGWEINKWDGPDEYYLISTGQSPEHGINGALFKPKEFFSATVNTIDVPDIDEYIKKVKDNGGTVVTKKTNIPGVGSFVYCKDVEGTMFGILQQESKPE